MMYNLRTTKSKVTVTAIARILVLTISLSLALGLITLSTPTNASLTSLKSLFQRVKNAGLSSSLFESVTQQTSTKSLSSEPDLLAIKEIKFGVTKDNKAWFDFTDESGNHIAHSDLTYQPHVLAVDSGNADDEFETFGIESPVSRKSRTYMSVTETHAITMVIHSAKTVSISAWNVGNVGSSSSSEKDVNVFTEPSFHLTPRNHIRSSDYHSGRRLASAFPAADDQNSHYIAYEYHSKFNVGACGAFVIEDLTGGDDGGVPSGPSVPFDPEAKVSTIKVDRLTLSDRVHRLDNDENSNVENNDNSQQSHSRRFLRSQSLGSRNLIAERWGNCYFDQGDSRYVEVGIISDLGYYRSFLESNNEDELAAYERVLESIEVIVANANLVYYFQFNVYIRARQIVITHEEITNGGVTESCPVETNIQLMNVLNQDPRSNRCCYSIETVLDGITSFSKSMSVRSLGDPGDKVDMRFNETRNRVSAFKQLAHWHLLTDCYPADCGSNTCTVGIAWLHTQNRKASICRIDGGTNVGVSSRTFQTWLTFAHELGHSFGAPHSFEHGQGKTGGIMDYGDGKYKGQYQFNDLRRPDLCPELEALVTQGLCRAQSISGTEVDLFPTTGIDCSQAPQFTPCEAGFCVKGQCLPMQTLLRVVQETNLYDDYQIEPAEFSPLPPGMKTVKAEIKVSSPLKACSTLNGDYKDKIVLVQRGNCQFLEKADFVSKTGAAAMIVYNNIDGPPKPIGGPGGIDFPVISISLDDGEKIINDMQLSTNGTVIGNIGGFPASLKNLPLNPKQSFFEKNKRLLAIFGGIAGGLIVAYFGYKYRVGISESGNYWREEIVDAAIERKHKLQNAWESTRGLSRRIPIPSRKAPAATLGRNKMKYYKQDNKVKKHIEKQQKLVSRMQSDISN